jgi:hypothetical protein
VLSTLKRLPGNASSIVGAADWSTLAARLPHPRTDGQVRELFYPKQAPPAGAPEGWRRPRFLESMSDEAYSQLYQQILAMPTLRFPEVAQLFALSKKEARVLTTIIHHVVAWLSPEPTVVTNKRETEKPVLRNDLVAPLQYVSADTIQEAEHRLGETSWADIEGNGAERASILLQQEVLRLVLAHLTEVQTPYCYLEDMPDETTEAQYIRRFSHKIWAGILTIVRQYVGPDFQPTWTVAQPGEGGEGREGTGLDDNQAASGGTAGGRTLHDEEVQVVGLHGTMASPPPTARAMAVRLANHVREDGSKGLVDSALAKDFESPAYVHRLAQWIAFASKGRRPPQEERDASASGVGCPAPDGTTSAPPPTTQSAPEPSVSGRKSNEHNIQRSNCQPAPASLSSGSYSNLPTTSPATSPIKRAATSNTSTTSTTAGALVSATDIRTTDRTRGRDKMVTKMADEKPVPAWLNPKNKAL